MDRRRRFDRGSIPDRGMNDRRRDERRRSSSSKQKFKLGDFKMKRILGFGSFSEVRKCTLRETSRSYAVKIIPKALVLKKNKTRHVSSEKKALILLKRHPLICSLKCTFQDRRCLYFVLEYLQNGELFTMWKRHERFSLEATRYYCAQITHIMQFIHDCGIIHLDLKPENLILGEDLNLRLVDFGTCLFVNDESTVGLSVLGTPEYTAPELVQRPPDQGITFSVDYWSLGVILFQLLAGRHPFKSGSNYLLFQKIINMQFEIPDDIPDVAKDLIKKLIVRDPEQRLGYKRPEELRKHPFFEGIDWDRIGTGQLTPPPFSEKLIVITPPTTSSESNNSQNNTTNGVIPNIKIETSKNEPETAKISAEKEDSEEEVKKGSSISNNSTSTTTASSSNKSTPEKNKKRRISTPRRGEVDDKSPSPQQPKEEEEKMKKNDPSSSSSTTKTTKKKKKKKKKKKIILKKKKMKKKKKKVVLKSNKKPSLKTTKKLMKSSSSSSSVVSSSGPSSENLLINTNRSSSRLSTLTVPGSSRKSPGSSGSKKSPGSGSRKSPGGSRKSPGGSKKSPGSGSRRSPGGGTRNSHRFRPRGNSSSSSSSATPTTTAKKKKKKRKMKKKKSRGGGGGGGINNNGGKKK